MSAAPIVSISAEACARDTPGLRRAPTVNQVARVVRATIPRSGFTTGTIPVGTRTSGARTLVPRNPSRATPTTVNGSPLR